MARRERAVEPEAAEPVVVSRRRPPQTAIGCRTYIRGELTDAFPQIVQGFVEAAKTGSCPHVKLATELLQTTQPKKAKRPAAVTALLRRMAAD